LKLEKLDEYKFPALQYLDLSSNPEITKPKQILEFCKRSPKLEYITLTGIPAAMKPGWLSFVCLIFD